MRIEAYSQIQQIYNTNRTTKTQEKKNVRPTDQLQIAMIDKKSVASGTTASSEVKKRTIGCFGYQRRSDRSS